MRTETERRRRWVLVATTGAAAIFLLLGWQGITTAGRLFTQDSNEYVLNAQYLSEHGSPAPAYISYEYSSPPLFEALAIAVDRVGRWLPSWPIEARWNVVDRLAWLALVIGSVWLLTSGRRVRPLGIAAATIAVLWGFDEAVSLVKTERWSAGQGVALFAAGGLIVVSGLIARELWPEKRGRWFGTAAFVAAYPIVLGMGVLFHPESLEALLAGLTMLAVIRAARRGWPVRSGVLAGALCGLAFWTRQSAVSLVVALIVALLLFGGRRARGFAVATLAAAVVVAGPWLAYAGAEWGNPLQGNLNSPGRMLAHGQSSSFYISFPVVTIVSEPYLPHLQNEFLPQLHASLWGDYFGEYRPSISLPEAVVRRANSTQSAIGLIADLLAIGGLAAYGIPAVVRAVRRKQPRPLDAAFGFLALVAVIGVLGLAAQVVRYPQVYGLEIKASYLLFTAPCWAVFSVASWTALRRKRWIGALLAGAAFLYVLAYGAALGADFTSNYPQQLNIVEPEGYSDLVVSIQNSTADRQPSPGTEEDFTIYVKNTGTGSAGNPVLRITLSRNLRLLGPPFFERGPGCTGTSTITCPFDFLPAGETTLIRMGLELTAPGPALMVASATAVGLDAHPADNRAAWATNVPG